MWTQPLPLPYQLLTPDLTNLRQGGGLNTAYYGYNLPTDNAASIPVSPVVVQPPLPNASLAPSKNEAVNQQPPIIIMYPQPKAVPLAKPVLPTLIDTEVAAPVQKPLPEPHTEPVNPPEKKPVEPDTALDDKHNELTPEVALQRVQTPLPLPTRPIEAARSFKILPNGTVVDNAKMPLVSEQSALSAKPPWQQHIGALAGGGLGSIAGVKLYHTLKPLNLKRLYWEPATKWPKINQLISTVSQPTLKGLRENTWLNNSLAWCKATMYLTPVMTGALWGERFQQRRNQAKQASALSVNA